MCYSFFINVISSYEKMVFIYFHCIFYVCRMTRRKKSTPFKVAFHKDCFICQRCFDNPIQWDKHIHGKFHQRHSKKIVVLHDDVVEDFLYEDMVELSEDECIIESFRAKGISIPSSVLKVCKIKKPQGRVKVSSLFEITESCILVDGDELVGLIIFYFFSSSVNQYLVDFLFKLYRTSGFVR